MNLRVRMFSTGDCSYCKILKQYLDEKGISCEDVILESDNKLVEVMNSEGEFAKPPFIIITQDDGSMIMIKGLRNNGANRI